MAYLYHGHIIDQEHHYTKHTHMHAHIHQNKKKTKQISKTTAKRKIKNDEIFQ